VDFHPIVVLLEYFKGELTVKQDLIKDVIQGMLPYLNNAQNEKLQDVLIYALAKYEVT
jgi:hypothetical protein